MSSLTKAVLRNEGCDIVYWYQGQGPLITFIPGGNGHGRQYFPIMAALASQFTCATFDRRQMSASKADVNRRMNPPQQARDVLAIIKQLGFEKSILFGSSAGGIIAFQFALDYPEAVDRLISHEAGTAMLLPDASELFEWVLHVYEIKESQGYLAAQAEFETRLLAYDTEGIPKCAKPEEHNVENFWENEILVLSLFTPNLCRLKELGVKVGLMTGVRSRGAFYVRTVYEQKKILGCLRMEVPGHHQGFEAEVEDFLPYFMDMLKVLDEK